MTRGLHFSPWPLKPQGKISRSRTISYSHREATGRFSFSAGFSHPHLFHQMDDVWYSYHWDSHDCFPVLSTSLIPSPPWWGTVDIALTHKASTAPNAHFSTAFLLLQSYFCFQSLPDPLSSFPPVLSPTQKPPHLNHLFFPSLGSGSLASYEPQESATFKPTYI